MKRIIIGITLEVVSLAVLLPILIQIPYYSERLDAWPTIPGKFLTIIDNLSMGIPFWIATAILTVGLIILIAEYFKGDK